MAGPDNQDKLNRQKRLCDDLSISRGRFSSFGPCKTFVPQLVQLYNSLRVEDKKLEIIMVSFDRDEDGFKEHFKCIPWLAVPFDVELNRKLSEIYGINRIPSFVSLASDEISIEEDLIGLIEDYGSKHFPLPGREERN
ncbi:hypothetical protein GH714_043136 [Hevea brasiliensis]|uniref:protein-disulfide reductase n=1 Tax=Hevea brasiliensis TaxID=3981 RepID=A0A6A6K3W6_HEVBR|nr:hypothetical protein GH714_043136 [Hevea brasiliensis]